MSRVGRGEINLEHMKRFELNIFAFFTKKIHHQLQIVSVGYILCHDGIIAAIQ